MMAASDLDGLLRAALTADALGGSPGQRSSANTALYYTVHTIDLPARSSIEGLSVYFRPVCLPNLAMSKLENRGVGVRPR